MNAGLLHKAQREVAPVTAVCGAALCLAVAMLAYILPTFQEDVVGQLWQVDLVRTIVKAALGAEVGDRLGPEMAGAFAWSHPVVIALVCAHGIIVCTRVPAGEVDRGGIDLLLAPIATARGGEEVGEVRRVGHRATERETIPVPPPGSRNPASKSQRWLGARPHGAACAGRSAHVADPESESEG